MQAARASEHIAPIHLRTRHEITAFLDGWDPVPPGWWPSLTGTPAPGRRRERAPAARPGRVARKPGQ
jgi:hypothetical protein